MAGLTHSHILVLLFHGLSLLRGISLLPRHLGDRVDPGITACQ